MFRIRMCMSNCLAFEQFVYIEWYLPYIYQYIHASDVMCIARLFILKSRLKYSS
jgi:hypothetical protein